MIRVCQLIRMALVLACASAFLFGSGSALARGGGRDVPVGAPALASGYSAALEQCATSAVAGERSVTFTAQMTAVPGTVHMEMRIDLQKRVAGDASFHRVVAPGLGEWRGSEAGVKIYKYVKQITNLVAPATYRAVVRFHWLGDRGRVLKRAWLRTASCEQPTITAPTATAPVGASGS